MASIGMTSRNETPIVTAMPTPTHAAVIAPRSKRRLTTQPRAAPAARCPPALELAARRRARQRSPPEVARVVAELVGDPEQPVVLGDPLGPGRRTGLDLAGAHGDDEVADRRVLGLAGAVGHDGGPSGAPREVDRVDRLGERPDLVELDQDGVRGPLVDR